MLPSFYPEYNTVRRNNCFKIKPGFVREYLLQYYRFHRNYQDRLHLWSLDKKWSLQLKSIVWIFFTAIIIKMWILTFTWWNLRSLLCPMLHHSLLWVKIHQFGNLTELLVMLRRDVGGNCVSCTDWYFKITRTMCISVARDR